MVSEDNFPSLNTKQRLLSEPPILREDDYQTESKDTNKRRKERPDILKKKVLLPHAVPSIFPNLPKHFSKEVPERRSESTSFGARFERYGSSKNCYFGHSLFDKNFYPDFLY